MSKDEFLMLAHPFNPKKHRIGGYYASEKLDGGRAFWDGGVSRGILSKDVPWANTEKDHIHSEPIVATGLWTRYGNVYHAPDWWLDELPNVPLDGELWMGRQGFQDLQSCIRKFPKNRDEEAWGKVRFMAFDIPNMKNLLGQRYIDNTNFSKFIPATAYDWWATKFSGKVARDHYDYRDRHSLLLTFRQNDVYEVHDQFGLLPDHDLAVEQAMELCHKITVEGGEGLIVRCPLGYWMPHRMHNIVKIKKEDDAEGIITGYTSGRETDKGSKLLGLIGALILNFNGHRLLLSGLTNEEREFASPLATAYASNNPDEVMPDWIEAKHFKRGMNVTFTYRELTRDGIPKEARFHRLRPAI